MTFLTVITRHIPSREELLLVNVNSLAEQKDPDYQQLILRDPMLLGIKRSHLMLAERDWSDIQGDYVLILDDDDCLTGPDVFRWIKQAAQSKPDLIVVRMDHGPLGLLPSVKDWGRLPDRNRIGVSAVIPTRAIFVEAVKHFQPVYTGDYDYVKACFNKSKSVDWLAIVATKVNQIGARTGK